MALWLVLGPYVALWLTVNALPHVPKAAAPLQPGRPSAVEDAVPQPESAPALQHAVPPPPQPATSPQRRTRLPWLDGLTDRELQLGLVAIDKVALALLAAFGGWILARSLERYRRAQAMIAELAKTRSEAFITTFTKLAHMEGAINRFVYLHQQVAVMVMMMEYVVETEHEWATFERDFDARMARWSSSEFAKAAYDSAVTVRQETTQAVTAFRRGIVEFALRMAGIPVDSAPSIEELNAMLARHLREADQERFALTALQHALAASSDESRFLLGSELHGLAEEFQNEAAEILKQSAKLLDKGIDDSLRDDAAKQTEHHRDRCRELREKAQRHLPDLPRAR